MAEFNVTTTGTVSTVTFPELGNRTLTHPQTVDLLLEYTLQEIIEAKSIVTAQAAGQITITDEDANPINPEENSNIISEGDAISLLDNDSGFVDATGAATAAPVQSVNGSTGDVSLDADDIDDSSTSNKFTTASEILKLANIEAGAQVNVKSDWNATSGDAEILNKPTVLPISAHASTHENGGADEINVAGLSGLLADAQTPASHTHTASEITDFDTEVSNNIDVSTNTTDRHTHANKAQLDLITDGDHDVRSDNPHSVTKTQVGLSNVPNTDATDRANHTGTQLASTISDFDAEVSNNVDVTSNTTDRHAAATVSDSSNIDLTIIGQDITADLTNTTVTPAAYTFTSLTVDAKGRITEANNGAAASTTVIGVQRNATLAEVNTGTSIITSVTPSGLQGSKYINQSGSKVSAIASGTNTYTATISPAITSYLNTQTFFIRFTNANTGASTLNLNGLGAISLRKSVSTQLDSGDILAGQVMQVAYDGTNFQIISGIGAAGVQTGLVAYNGQITPPSFAVDQNDYAPTGIETANVIRLTATVNSNVTGIIAPSPLSGQVVFVVNIGANSITLSNNNAGSISGNRFLMAGNKILQSNESVQICYDLTSLRWRVISENV